MKNSTKSTIVNDIKQLNSYTIESMLDVFNTTERKLTEDELAFYAELYKELESRKEQPSFGHGGNIAEQNKEMLNNQAREVDHHIDELNNVLKSKVDVEPWVVAKMERATTDLSDITHYLDGEQHKEYSKPVYAIGGVIGKDITFNKWDETRQGTILELTDDGDYVVSSGAGSTLVSPDDVISFNEPKAKAKRFGFFEEGGGVGDVKKYEIIDSNSSKESLNNILDAIRLVNSKGLDLKLIDKTGHYAGGYNHINSVYVNSSMDFSDLVRKFNDILYSNDIYNISIIGVYAKGGSMYDDGGGVDDDFVIFSIDDDALDTLLFDNHRSEIDYEDIHGDSYYKLNRRDFDRFIDYADSIGFDVDYENNEDAVVYVVNPRMAEGGGVGHKKKPKLLVDLYNELSKAKNLVSLNWGYDKDEGHHIIYKSGLESESDYHKGELEEYYFYINDNNKIEGVYALSGNSGELKSIEEALYISRANENVKMVRGGYLEGREEYEGYKYKIFYNPKKGMYSIDDEIGIFKGDNNYFEKYDQAKEHAEISIRSMLSDKDDKMAEGGGVGEKEEKYYVFNVQFTHGKKGDSKVIERQTLTVPSTTEKGAERKAIKAIRDIYKYQKHVFGYINPELLSEMTLMEYIESQRPKYNKGVGIDEIEPMGWKHKDAVEYGKKLVDKGDNHIEVRNKLEEHYPGLKSEMQNVINDILDYKDSKMTGWKHKAKK